MMRFYNGLYKLLRKTRSECSSIIIDDYIFIKFNKTNKTNETNETNETYETCETCETYETL